MYSSNFDINIFNFNVTGNLNSGWVFQVNATYLGVKQLKPVSLDFYNGIGYYCDSLLGVFEFSLANLTSTPPTFPIVNELYEPLSFGSIFSCTLNSNGGFFTVDTTGGTAVYSLPNLNQVYIYPFNASNPVNPIYGMYSTFGYTAGYVNTQVTVKSKKSNVVTFRIYSNSVSYLNSLVIDLYLQSILLNDLSNTNPAFTLYQSNSGSTFIIINGGLKLLVYLIEPGSILTFPPQPKPYTYSGTLTVTNGRISVNYPVGINGVSPNSTMIYPIKGLYPGLYPAYTSYSLYVLSVNQTTFTTYVPLSNYYTGCNVTYNLINTTQNNYLTFTIPSKSQLLTTVNVSNVPSVIPTIFTLTSNSNFDIIAVIASNNAAIYMYQNNALLAGPFSLGSGNPSLNVTQVVLYQGDVYYFILECSGVYNGAFTVN